MASGNSCRLLPGALRRVSIPTPRTALFSNFLTPWDYPSASYIFIFPALGSTSFSESLGFFYWGLVFRSSTLAWKIPWMEEPGRLQSMGLLRVGHDWATSITLFTFIHWRRKWQPTPVFLPGESQGQGSLVGCRLWGRIDSDTTEAT